MAPPLHWWCLVQTLAQVKKKPLCLNKPGADNVQSVSFRANSPVMEFCLIVFNLKISLTRAQTELWYFCVLSQFCSAESWLEPERSNAFQKALRWGGWMKTLYTFSPFTLMSASWTVTTAWRGGWMKAPCWLLSPLNYSGKMDVSLRQIVPGISYRDQTGLQINVSEKWETGVKKNTKRRKGFRILGFRWNKVGE